jgi:hypothetical protein
METNEADFRCVVDVGDGGWNERTKSVRVQSEGEVSQVYKPRVGFLQIEQG